MKLSNFNYNDFTVLVDHIGEFLEGEGVHPNYIHIRKELIELNIKDHRDFVDKLGVNAFQKFKALYKIRNRTGK